MHLDAVGVAGGQVVVQARQQAHDVRWATRALVPPLASRAALDRVAVIVAHMQRVDVRVAMSIERQPGEHAVVERAFEGVREACLAGHQQQPPAPHHRSDRRAGLAVAAIRGQLVRVAERLVHVVSPSPPVT